MNYRYLLYYKGFMLKFRDLFHYAKLSIINFICDLFFIAKLSIINFIYDLFFDAKLSIIDFICDLFFYAIEYIENYIPSKYRANWVNIVKLIVKKLNKLKGDKAKVVYLLNYAKSGKPKNSKKSSFVRNGVVFIRVRIYTNHKRYISSSPPSRMDRNSDDSGIDDVEPSSPVSSDEGNNGPTGQNVNNGVGDTNNRNVGQSTVLGQGSQTASQQSSGQNRAQPSNLTMVERAAAGYFSQDWISPSRAKMLEAVKIFQHTWQYNELTAKNAKFKADKAARDANASSSSAVAVESTAGSSSTSNQPFTNSSLSSGVTSNASNPNGEGGGSVVQSGATDSNSTENEGFLGVGPQSSPLKRKHSSTELPSNKRQDISDSDDDDDNGGKGGPSGFSGGGGPSGPDGGGGPSSSNSLKTMVKEGELLSPLESDTLTRGTPLDFVIELESTTCIHDDLNFWDEII